MLLYVLVTVTSVQVLVQHIAVHQILLYALATVTLVLVLVQHITVQLFLPRVPEPAPSVLVQVQHIAVHLLLLVQQDSIAQPHIIVVTARGTAQHQ